MQDSLEVRVQAVLFSADRLLCVRHRKTDADYWVLPGGHLEPGESIWDALDRELGEETGLGLEAGHLWTVSEFHSADRHVVDVSFFVTGFVGRLRLGDDPEIREGPPTLVELGWFDREAFVEASFRPTVLARHLRAHWGDGSASASYLGVESV